MSDEKKKKRDWVFIGQRIAAVLYGIAAVLKPIKPVEDVAAELLMAHEANRGSWIEGPSGWFAGHPWFVIAVCFVSMIALAVVYWRDRWLVRAAAAGNLVMLALFVAILHRAAPQIFVIDGAMAALAVAIILRQNRKIRERAGAEGAKAAV
ncbi:MAG: hypothetical protein HY720_12120 [Planctomycetes bacterium]|nr:hypothetical protein [Planctomycetota bacterium]